MNEAKPSPETGPCARCGAETEIRIGDLWICERCYEIRSSCCAEFADDDLTRPDGDGDRDG